jgi:integrase
MARKNKLEIAKDKHGNNIKNIYTLINASGHTEYYTSFMLDGISYQKKNLTKRYPTATTPTKAIAALESAKSEIRDGGNPFKDNSRGDKVRDIILKQIKAKKPLVEGKDNSRYLRSLELFYNNYIDPIVGHLRLDKVQRKHALTILNSLDGNTKSFKLLLNVIMFKTFEDAFRAGKINTNPFFELDYGKHKPKESFDIRLNEPMEVVARKLYNTAINFNLSHRLLFVLSIMLVRRIGELHQLKFSHIHQYSDGSWYVITTEDITKTGIKEKYPLPKEVVELLPENILDTEYKNDQLFRFAYSGIFLKQAKLIKEANIQMNEGHKLTPHDNRYLFISILSSLGIDSDIADRCLSHNHTKQVKQIYLDTPYEKRKMIFEKWWEFLRTK